MTHLNPERRSSLATDVDEVNDMDNVMDGTEQQVGGVSRRDMIKASVIAGGLMWSAPVLLTGKAAAATPCCPNGTPVRFKLPSASSTNCGNACFDGQPAFASITCSTAIGDCLINPANEFVKGVFKMGGTQADVVLKPGVTLIAAAAKGTSDCHFTVCPCFATAKNPPSPDPNCPAGCSSCLNFCAKPNGNACTGMGAPTYPPNRIWVLLDTSLDAMGNPQPDPGFTTLRVDTGPDSLNFVDLVLCLAPAITGIC